MANELSRISERLIRARERSGHGAASVWVPPPARREPPRRERVPEPSEKPQYDAASKRGPATWVAIHVQLRHEHEPVHSVFDARAHEDQEDEDQEVFVDAPAVSFEDFMPAPKALPSAAAGEAFVAPKLLSGDVSPAGRQPRAPGLLQYLAARALNAYLTHSSFASGGSSESRLLDLQA